MDNSKKTKKSLYASVMSLVLCCAMLIGTTFAWFTDHASTGVNKIQAGTLDIELQMQDANGKWVSAEGETLNFVKAQGGENEEILWEPGCTYNLQSLKLVNNSNLALKYKVLINGIKGDATLNDAIDWTIELGGESLEIGKEMHWLPGSNGSDEKVFTISGTMKEDAGNEYQGLSIDGISITVVATQDTVEHDSKGITYDDEAEYPEPVLVNSTEGLSAAVASVKDGGVVALTAKGDYILPDSAKGKEFTITGTEDTVIKVQAEGEGDYALDGSDVTFEGVTIETTDAGFQGFVRANTTFVNCTIKNTLTLYGESKFVNCTFKVSGDKYNVWTWGQNVTFEGCTFNCDGKAMLVYGGTTSTVNINNCTFNDNGSISGKAAIETGTSYGESFNININNTIVNGFEVNPDGTNTGTAIWANKNSMPTDKLNVVIDGVDVY